MGAPANRTKDTYLREKPCPKCGTKMERCKSMTAGKRYMMWCCTNAKKIGKTENYESLCGHWEKA